MPAEHPEDRQLIERLTPTQALIFRRLRRGNAVPAEDLIHTIYGHRSDGGPISAKRVIYTQISLLRKRLEDTPYTIKTMGWSGYKLGAKPNE